MKDIGQLALSIELPVDETFSTYKRLNDNDDNSNNENPTAAVILKEFIKSFSEHDAVQSSFFLFGLSGVGKSHLLHATCSYAAELGLTSQCISLSELYSYSSDLLIGLESIDVICIDDIHFITGNNEWERSVFDLFNRLMESNKCVVISADNSVNDLGLELPDLVSRLSWGQTLQVKPLTDEEKINAIQFKARQRGLLLSDDAGRFLINHLSRSMKDLAASLEQLDKASIKEQRKLTIPFIKEILLP